jgi:ATP-dependent DNA ligase
VARRDLKRVRLVTRNGSDVSQRFPQIVAAIAVLPVRSCLIDVQGVRAYNVGGPILAEELERFGKRN